MGVYAGFALATGIALAVRPALLDGLPIAGSAFAVTVFASWLGFAGVLAGGARRGPVAPVLWLFPVAWALPIVT
jgi:hypothetical protein